MCCMATDIYGWCSRLSNTFYTDFRNTLRKRRAPEPVRLCMPLSANLIAGYLSVDKEILKKFGTEK